MNSFDIAQSLFLGIKVAMIDGKETKIRVTSVELVASTINRFIICGKDEKGNIRTYYYSTK